MMIISLLLIASCAILNRLGGSKNKNWRRWGIGIALAIYGILTGVTWYYALACIATSQLFRLPITFKGDSIPEHWYNWAWLPIVGFLYGLVPFPLSIPEWTNGLIYAGVFGGIFGIIVALSNIKATADIFKWDRVELVYGALISLIAVLFRRKK